MNILPFAVNIAIAVVGNLSMGNPGILLIFSMITWARDFFFFPPAEVQSSHIHLNILCMMVLPYMYPSTVFTINIDDYRYTERDFEGILETLKSSAWKWKDIGLALGFTYGELSMIECNPMLIVQHPPLSYLRHVLRHWLQWGPGDGRGSRGYATYGMLSAALWKVNMGAHASNLPQGMFIASAVYIIGYIQSLPMNIS